MGDRHRRPVARRLIRTALTLGLLIVAAVALVHTSSGGPSSPAQRSEAIAESLRCPTCNGLSVADSTSPMAGSMREMIDDQIAAGRSDEQIRGHFVDLYSDWVLLQPPASGGGWLIWTVPALVAVVGVVLVLVLAGRVRLPRHAGWGVTVAGIGMIVVLSLQVNTGDRAADGLLTGSAPAGPDGQAGAPEGGDGLSESGGTTSDEEARRRIDQLQEQVRADPGNTDLRLSLASEAFTAGQPELVRTHSQEVLDQEPRNADALLLRSLSTSDQHDSDGLQAVRDYLAVAPQDHPGRQAIESLAEQLAVTGED